MILCEASKRIGASLIARAAEAAGEVKFAREVRAGAWDVTNRADIAAMANDAAALLSDMGEVSPGLVEWADDQMTNGSTPAEVREALREAVRLSGRA